MEYYDVDFTYYGPAKEMKDIYERALWRLMDVKKWMPNSQYLIFDAETGKWSKNVPEAYMKGRRR